MNTATLASAPAATTDHTIAAEPRPWWRHGHVWLVISGPAIVVVASIVTIVLAVRQPDPVVAADYYRRGIEINKTLAGSDTGAKALMPAVQARNHAASPAPAAQAGPPAASPAPGAAR